MINNKGIISHINFIIEASPLYTLPFNFYNVFNKVWKDC
jgi:hypothetical protein